MTVNAESDVRSTLMVPGPPVPLALKLEANGIGVPIRTQKQKRTERVQLGAFCALSFLSGWADGSIGPLIPKIQEFYHLSYTIVSLIFVFKCIGYVLGSIANILFTKKYGFGRMLLFGSTLQIISHALQILAIIAPFEVFILGNFFLGAGQALHNSQSTGYIASLRISPKTKMGIFQAFYGAGCLFSPLVATKFSNLPERGHWAFCYLVGLGLTLINLVDVWFVFRGRPQNVCLGLIGQLADDEAQQTAVFAAEVERYAPSPPNTASVLPEGAPAPAPVRPVLWRSRESYVGEMLSLKSLHLLAVFLFIYVGTEVTVSGWIVSFVLQVRGGGSASGYTASAFWGGFTVGRVALLPLNKWLGEPRAMYIYPLLCIGLELILLLVPSFPASATAASLIGLLFGPIFPMGINHAARILPVSLLTPCIAWLSGFASIGGALFPFFTGAIIGRVGFKSMPIVTIGMLGAMLATWWVVPRARK
ncbi:MFS domain-containing protein [Mycena kentingensis (nom. inval.)]|nr:MFS domain-containing protein [Mycena kentingensis (nom. inval.)]